MTEAVSDILRLRAQQADGLTRTVWVSAGAHVLLLLVFFVVPADWRTSPPQAQATPMTISLAGAEGPDNGGMTQLSGRAVQEMRPLETRSRVETPAANTPMALPDPSLRARPRPTLKPIEKPVEKSPSRTPTTGAEPKTGAARADTGAAPIPFGGLSTGGGGGQGVTLDVGDFCCPEYIQVMRQRIMEHWTKNRGTAGLNIVKFTIARNGMLSGIEVSTSSRNPILDMESRRAVTVTQRLPPLPPAFTRPTLTVFLTFEYNR
jgi:TonB family protein